MLTEPSYQLIAAAQGALDLAQRRRDTVLQATFAAAGIVEDATVLRIDAVDGKQVLYYTTPNGAS